MKAQFNNITLAAILSQISGQAMLQMSHLVYLMVNNSGGDLQYPHMLENGEEEIRRASPGDFIAVYPGGSIRVVEKSHYCRQRTMRDMVDVLAYSNARGGVYTATREADDAASRIFALNSGLSPEGLWHVRWVPCTMKIKAFLLPRCLGDFQIDIEDDPKHCYTGNSRTHCVIVREGEKDAYVKEIIQLQNGWHVVGSNVHGVQITQKLLRLDPDQVSAIIELHQSGVGKLLAA